MPFTHLKFIILIVFFVCSINNRSYAQLWRYVNNKGIDKNTQKQDGVYKIISTDGRVTQVRIVRKTLTDGITRIKTSADKWGIRETMGIDTVFLLSKNLLLMRYSPHGGSNDGYQNTLILSINKSKISIAMEMMSSHVFGGGGPEGIYDLNLKLTGENLKDYKLNVAVRDIDSSGVDSSKQHDLRRNFVLKFDDKRNVFYNNFKKINRTVDFYNNKTYKWRRRHIAGTYPVIIIDDYEYYYIGNIWYAGGKNTFTSRYSFVPSCEPLK